MTSLVVHFYSAPLVCFVDALDRELNFAWNGCPTYIDLGFYGTGTYSHFAKDEKGRKFHGDDFPADGAVPEDLNRLLGSPETE